MDSLVGRDDLRKCAAQADHAAAGVKACIDSLGTAVDEIDRAALLERSISHGDAARIVRELHIIELDLNEVGEQISEFGKLLVATVAGQIEPQP